MPVSLRGRVFGTLLALTAATLVSAALLPAGEPPKREDINAKFRNPDVSQSIKSFEGESREIYQKRDEILAACSLRSGTASGLAFSWRAPIASRDIPPPIPRCIVRVPRSRRASRTIRSTAPRSFCG